MMMELKSSSNYKEAETGDSKVESAFTQAEVTKVVSNLLGSSTLGVDETEHLKSLGDVGLSWLTRLCNIAGQTGAAAPCFKKGDRRVYSNYRGIMLLSLPVKVSACYWRGQFAGTSWNHRIPSLLFADDVLLTSLDRDLQHVLGHFSAECEAARMKMSTSGSEVIVLGWQRVVCCLQVGREVLSQVHELQFRLP